MIQDGKEYSYSTITHIACFVCGRYFVPEINRVVEKRKTCYDCRARYMKIQCINDKYEIKTIVVEKPPTAWRLFGFDNNILKSIVVRNENTWEPKNIYKAKCLCGQTSVHTCGIYCYNSLDNPELVLYFSESDYILGEIYYWGIVHKYKLGYRVQYVKIKRLYMNIRRMSCFLDKNILSKKYNCPVGILLPDVEIFSLTLQGPRYLGKRTMDCIKTDIQKIEFFEKGENLATRIAIK